MTDNASAIAEPQPARVPPKPSSRGVAAFCWAGIIAAAGGSLTFNIYHDSRYLTLQLIAVIAGILPPFLATVLAHVAQAIPGVWGKVVIFVITGGAMSVSAIASSAVLKPAYSLGGAIVFSLVMDSASLACLFALILIYEARAEYRKWLEAGGQQHPGAAPGTGIVPAGSGVVVPGTGTVPGNRADDIVPGTAAGPAGNACDGVPGNGQRAGAGPVTHASGAAAAALDDPGPSSATPRRARPASDPGAGAGAGETREAVVAEIAARPRPALESTSQTEARALEVVREFKRRTGQRMNNAELARALGVRKQAVVATREAIRTREEPAA